MTTRSTCFPTLSRRSLLSLGTAGVAAAMLPQGRGLAQASGGTLVMTIVAEPNSKASALSSASPVTVISGKMVEGLVSYDFDLTPQPKLATARDIAPNGLSVTFTLRNGVKWHDGKPFTSADAAFSLLELIKAHHPRGRGVFAPFETVGTADPQTAILRLSRPSPALMAALDGWETPMRPKHVHEGTDYLKDPVPSAPSAPARSRARTGSRAEMSFWCATPNTGARTNRIWTVSWPGSRVIPAPGSPPSRPESCIWATMARSRRTRSSGSRTLRDFWWKPAGQS